VLDVLVELFLWIVDDALQVRGAASADRAKIQGPIGAFQAVDHTLVMQKYKCSYPRVWDAVMKREKYSTHYYYSA
jgi:hypothetical protein